MSPSKQGVVRCTRGTMMDGRGRVAMSPTTYADVVYFPMDFDNRTRGAAIDEMPSGPARSVRLIIWPQREASNPIKRRKVERSWRSNVETDEGKPEISEAMIVTLPPDGKYELISHVAFVNDGA